MVRLRVSDTGVGVTTNPELAPSATLGLQLVRDLARQIGGHLESGSGPGATFDVTFTPTAPRAAHQASGDAA